MRGMIRVGVEGRRERRGAQGRLSAAVAFPTCWAETAHAHTRAASAVLLPPHPPTHPLIRNCVAATAALLKSFDSSDSWRPCATVGAGGVGFGWPGG